MTDNPPELLDPNRVELVSVLHHLASMSSRLERLAGLMQDDEVEICSECKTSRFLNWPERQAQENFYAAKNRIDKALALLTAARHIAP